MFGIGATPGMMDAGKSMMDQVPGAGMGFGQNPTPASLMELGGIGLGNAPQGGGLLDNSVGRFVQGGGLLGGDNPVGRFAQDGGLLGLLQRRMGGGMEGPPTKEALQQQDQNQMMQRMMMMRMMGY